MLSRTFASNRGACGFLARAFLALLAGAFTLTAGSPELSLVTPRIGQQGTEVETVFRGERLADAQEILFYDPGISVVTMKSRDDKRLKVRLKIAPDARLGSHLMRVRTLGGLTEARTFSVGQYPVVDEMEPNDDFAQPQPVVLNTTVAGVADNEDIDYYIVEARKGQRLTAEVEAMRLGSELVDCHVAIMDTNRFELAASDDSSLALQDSIASVSVPADGNYIVAVRESSYAGNRRSRYCLHLGEAPRPLIAYPAGGPAGGNLDVTFLGDVQGDLTRSIQMPELAKGDFPFFLQLENQSVPSPNTLRVVPFGNVLEVEPNNRARDATVAVAAVPLAFNGVIQEDLDIDFFRFQARKGDKYHVRCVARGVRSPLDSVLTLHNGEGRRIEGNDDSGGPDSYLQWTVPEDGDYLVAVRDHLRKGGAEYVYRVEFTPVQPNLSLTIPSFARRSQERNAVPIPRGNRFATLLRVERNNFNGDVLLEMPELPEGVSMAASPIAGNVNEVPVVFEASAEAPLTSMLVPVHGRHAEQEEITGEFEQTIDLIYGRPNNTVYYTTVVDRMAMAVTEEAPFKITVVEPKVPLVRDGSMRLKVVAERFGDFEGEIKLRMLWNPPGVGSQNEVTLEKDRTEAYYSVNANDKAAINDWKIVILARGDAGQGTVWTSSQPVTLSIAEPFLSMTIPMAAGEQGQPVSVLGELDQLRPFEGEAEVKLHGIPPKVAIEQNPIAITKEDEQIIFAASLAEDAPVGQHKSLFCTVTIIQDGEPIVHNVGGRGTLRIDRPPPPKKDAPEQAKEVAQAEPEPAKQAPPPKPLSRLEKLRLEAKERALAKQNENKN